MGLLAKFLRKKENKYDHIISLGYNCEVAFRFLKYFKFEESNLFNWSYVRTIDDLINAIANFDKIGAAEFEGPNPLWECQNTNIRFHGKLSINLYINRMVTEEDKNRDKEELKSRLSYLKEKFLKTLKDESRKLYIYKIKSTDIDENTNFKLVTLIEKLKNLGGKNFQLLVVSEEKVQLSINQAYLYRTVKHFAPDSDVTSRKYLKNGWNKIFDEFYQPKIKAKKKKYKFGEI